MIRKKLLRIILSICYFRLITDRFKSFPDWMIKNMDTDRKQVMVYVFTFQDHKYLKDTAV